MYTCGWLYTRCPSTVYVSVHGPVMYVVGSAKAQFCGAEILTTRPGGASRKSAQTVPLKDRSTPSTARTKECFQWPGCNSEQTPSLTSSPYGAHLHTSLSVKQNTEGRGPVLIVAPRMHLKTLGTARRQQVGLLHRQYCYASALRSAGRRSTDPRPLVSVCMCPIRPSDPT